MNEWFVELTQLYLTLFRRCYGLEVCNHGYKRVVPDYEKVGSHHHAARYVAVKKKVIGQGSERNAFQFYEVAQDMRSIIGKPFIAKESCYIQSGETEKYARKFCTTQIFTKRIAGEFNQKLDSLVRLAKATPRIRVLDCSIYHVNDAGGRRSFLVEERLNHMKWTKWNSNVGTRKRRDIAVSLVCNLRGLFNQVTILLTDSWPLCTFSASSYVGLLPSGND